MLLRETSHGPQSVRVVGGVVAVVDCCECSANSAWLAWSSALQLACEKVVFTSCAFHSIFAWALLKSHKMQCAQVGQRGTQRHPEATGKRPIQPSFTRASDRFRLVSHASFTYAISFAQVKLKKKQLQVK